MTDRYTNSGMGQPSFNDENEIQFQDIVKLVWSHKWWYVISVTICLAAAVFYLYRTQKVYTRTQKVLIDESSQDATMRNLGVASSGMMRVRGMNSTANEIEAITSPDLMQEVVERLSLETRYVEDQFLRNVEMFGNNPLELQLAGNNPQSGFSFKVSNLEDGNVSLSDFKIKKNKYRQTIEARLGDTIQTPAGALILWPTDSIGNFKHDVRIINYNSMSVAKAYCANLDVTMVGKETTVLAMVLEDHFPSRASAILTTLVDVYNEEWIANKNKSSVKTSEFINDRLVVIEKDLAAIEKALKEYKESNNLTDLKLAAQATLQESSQHSAKAFEVNNKLSVAKFIKEYLDDHSNDGKLIPSNLGLESNSVESQIKSYNDLVIRRDRYMATSSENNPLVSDLDATINSMKEAVLSSIENLIASLTIQKAQFEERERQILSKLSSSSEHELMLLSLGRQQSIIQSLYTFLLQKREETELASLVNVGNTRVLMKPNGSDRPASPKRRNILLIALLIGCALPFAYFYIRKMLDTTVKTKSDLSNLTLPILAEIPALPYTGKLRFKRMVMDKYDNSQTDIIVEAGKRDMMNEAYRVLRTNVDLILKRDDKSKVVMLTSFNPNAGKTFTSINLAASFALKGSKVLLVDMDLRKGTLSKVLDIVHSGVSAYLSGRSDDILPSATQIRPNLSVLPVGTLPVNPAELLLSERFTNMISILKENYDYIFLDCPPIEVVVDSTIITGHVDMTIFVARAGVLDKRALPLVEQLYAEKTYTSMVLMLNAVDIKNKKYGYGSLSYGYGYGN